MKKVISAIFILFTGITLALLLFRAGKVEYYLKREFLTGNIPLLLYILLFSFTIILLMMRFGKGAERFLEKYSAFLLPVALLLLFAGELVFVRAFFFYQDWDPLAVLSAVYHTLHGETAEISVGYFSAHPNNLALVALYLGILKLAGILGSESVLIIAGAQCLLITLSAFLLFRILRAEGCSYLCAWGAFLIYALWIGFSPWIVCTYSDMTGLVFPVLVLRLFQLLSGGRLREGVSYALWCLLGLLGALGYAIKPQTVIVLISVVFIYIFRSFRERGGWKWLPVFCLSFILAHVLLSAGLSKVLPVELDSSRNFSAVHYFMMGLNDETDGVYSKDDTEYTSSFDDPKERKKADLELAKKRMADFGLKGLASHLEKKQLVDFGDGTFSWGIDGNFFAGKEIEGLPSVKETRFTPFLESWLFTEGQHYPLYSTIRQSMWLIILFFCLLAGVFLSGASDTMISAALSIVGLTVFELLFEAKARYLLICTPVFLLLAVFGIQGFCRALSPELRSTRHFRRNTPHKGSRRGQ
ncbi:MAG: hypothetical protein K5985_10800 [Lachnospiraceae bacterium]|nr:hypothetical protein [Lachnospiraceae bacterium]